MMHRRTIVTHDGMDFAVDTADIGGKWETMIFRAKKNGDIIPSDEYYTERYDSERKAEEGHARIVHCVDSILAEKLGEKCH